MEPVAKCFQKSFLRNTGYGSFTYTSCTLHVYTCTAYGEIFMVVKIFTDFVS